MKRPDQEARARFFFEEVLASDLPVPDELMAK